MDQGKRIRVMIVDHAAVIHSGLKTWLHAYNDIQILAEASDGEEAVRLCAHAQPDVILMETLLPRLNGIAATQLIRTRHPQIQTVIFTDTVNTELLQAALRAGAMGYLLKNISAEDLVTAIRKVHSRRFTVAPEVTQWLLRVTTNHELPLGYDLTEREREILHLLVAGMNNRAIAQVLTVSLSTVKFHVSNILVKLNAKARTQAIALALRHNLVAQAG